MHRHVFDHTLALVGATGGRTAVHKFLRPAPPKRGTVVWRVERERCLRKKSSSTPPLLARSTFSPPAVSPGGEEVWCRVVELRGRAAPVSQLLNPGWCGGCTTANGWNPCGMGYGCTAGPNAGFHPRCPEHCTRRDPCHAAVFTASLPGSHCCHTQLSVGGVWKSESKDIFHDYFVASP